MSSSSTSARFTTADGVDVAAYDFGGEGPALLVAHATGFHAHSWLPVIERLRRSFHCYGFDSRGHGDSAEPPGGDFTWHGFATDALAVVEGFDLTRPFAAGHSCGGALLLLAEERQPGTFAGLFLFEPIGSAADLTRVPVAPPRGPGLAALARKRRAEFPSKQAALENYRRKGPFAVFTEEALRAYVDYGFAAPGGREGIVRLKCEPESEARTYEMSMFHDAFARADRVRCPATFACGDAPGPAPLVLLDAVAQRVGSEGTAFELAGHGHFAPMADPDLMATLITESLLGTPG